LARSANAPVQVFKKRDDGRTPERRRGDDLSDTSHTALRLALGQFGPGHLSVVAEALVPRKVF
jgi:hypothetical protein